MASDGPVANMQPAVETPITPRANADDGDEVETGLVSGVKVELVDWSKYARPCEVVLLTCVGILLVVFGLSGTTWTSGYNAQLKLVTAGLHWSRVAGDPWDMQTGQLNRACAAVGRRGTVACSLATAGNMAAACGWIAFVVACVLAGTFLAQGLDKLGALGGVRAKLPPTLPLEALASYLPTACWALLLVLLFLTLLTYAAMAPASLGGGLAYLGASYGAVRLAFFLSLLGLGVNLSLFHKLGEDYVIALLDLLRGRWTHMQTSQKLTQLLLFVALVCAMLLWVRRVDWGVLLILYGLWAHAEHSHDHLSLFACAALFSAGTDALTLAADSADPSLVEAATWILLSCKLLVVATLIYRREAFV